MLDDLDPMPTPAYEPAPMPSGPVLVYAEQPYRLALYREPPGPGVTPVQIEVPRGLAVMSPEDWTTCREQPRFCSEVQTVGLAGSLPPALADAWAAVPRKQAVALLGATRDGATLGALLALPHHQDVRVALVEALGEVRPGAAAAVMTREPALARAVRARR
jgi:hypothetical protein